MLLPASRLSYREVETMAEAKNVADYLVRYLQQIDPRPLKGSELAVLIKTAYPDFSPESFGCRNLREFIHRNADEIVEFSRAGMDIVYRLRTTQERLNSQTATADESDSVVDQLTQNLFVWKTFATPDSVFRLYLDPQAGVIHNLHSNARPAQGWREIPRISAEVLLQIGKDFTSDLPEVQKSALAPLLQAPKWWVPFYDCLQTLGLRSKWIEFRRRRIRDEFQRIVRGIEAPSPTEQSAMARPLVSEPTRAEAGSPIRKVAADVVQRMTESELRALNLPLGYVMDSLTAR